MKSMNEYGIGNTPLIELESVHDNRIFVKLEAANYLGSIKARSAYFMMRDLSTGADNKIIVESTSGNLGYSLGFFSKVMGREFIALIDPSISANKLRRLEEAGIRCQIITAENGLDYRSARILTARRMAESGEYHWLNQYDNPSNIRAHYLTTAPEIWEQTAGTVTYVVCAMGSCGTICGVGEYFHERNPNITVVGVEPYGSTICGTVKAEYLNVGAGLAEKPGNYLRCPGAVDQAYTVKDADSIEAMKILNEKYHINVGVTSGMAYFQAMRLSRVLRNQCIVVISPDGRESYSQYL